MFKRERCVEYFFDSNIYSKEQIIKNIQKEEKVFEKKNSEMSINLNEYGIYEVKLKFIENKLPFLYVINNKEKDRYKKQIEEPIKYGSYKETKTYQPI